MNKFLPLLNLLLRFKFLRERIMQSAINPIYLNAALDNVARQLKSNGFEAVADNVSKLSLVVHIQLVPTRELMKGATLVWQTPASVRTAKRRLAQASQSVPHVE